MSNEINLQIRASLKNGAVSGLVNTQNLINQAVPDVYDKVVATSTTPAALATGLATPGLAFLQNIDPTNAVSFGLLVSSTFYALGTLPPGPSAGVGGPVATLIIASGTTIYLKAAAGTPEVLVQVWNA